MAEYMLYVGCHGVDDPNRAGLVFAAARGVHKNKDLIARKVGFKIALLADAVLLMKRAIAQNTIIAGPDRGSVADLIGQLGKGVEIHCTPELAQLEIGRWVHIGDGNSIRCHEGSLRIGDKVVFGKDNTVNCYLDVEIGAATLVADWVYVCDFDHVVADITLPIKDQGIVKTPVRIGPDCWLGVKTSVLRGTRIGRGCVLGAHAVARGDIPDYAIAVGTPARVVRDRRADYDADAERRAAVADMARKADEALKQALTDGP